MTMANGFHTPEEAALGLDLPLVGALPAPGEIESPVAATLPEDEHIRSECQRIAERVLAPEVRERGPVGVVGNVGGAQLAHVTNLIATASALTRPVVLVDADLSGAHLAFDTVGQAQEGLVDVLRYGVRAARLIAPTRTPGLNLLPVGAGTVDIEGTFASPAVEGLFSDLERAGELVLVNGPAAEDLAVAGPFGARVGSWILVHDLAHSAAEFSASICDRLGPEKILGVVVLGAETVAEMPVREAPPELPAEVRVEAPPEAPVEVLPEEPTEVLAVDAPVAAEPEPEPVPKPAPPPAPPRERGPVPKPAPPPAPPPERERTPVPKPAPPPVAKRPARPESPAPAEPEPAAKKPRGRSRRGVLVGGIVVLGIAAVWAVRTFLPSEPPPPARPADRELAGERIVPLDSVQALHSPASELAALATVPADTEPAAPGAAAPEEEIPPEVAPQVSREADVGESETPPPAAPTEVYGVHVSSLTTEKDAWEDSERFYARGYSVAVRGEDVPGKGHWYRVYVGPFVEREEASRVAAEVRESGLADYTRVRRLPASLFEQPQGGVRGER